MILSNIIPPWAKILIKCLPYAAIAVLFVCLSITRATLHNVRLNDLVVAARTKADVAEQKAKNTEQQKTAVEEYASKIESIQPIILHNTETIHDYAATPAGSAPCLSSDRVSGINGTRQKLFPSSEGSDSSVSTDTSKR